MEFNATPYDEYVEVIVKVSKEHLTTRDPEEFRRSLGEGVYRVALQKVGAARYIGRQVLEEFTVGGSH